MWNKHRKEVRASVPGALARGQRKLADWLGRKWEALSGSRRRVLMVGLCLFITGYLLVLMLGVIGVPALVPDQITRPITERNEVVRKMGGARENITRFRQLMDSLSASDSGRATRDSILSRHPGILDTIAELELFIGPINKTENETTKSKN